MYIHYRNVCVCMCVVLNTLRFSIYPWQWELEDINKTIERLKAAAAVRMQRVQNVPRETQQERNFRTQQFEKLLQSISALLTMSNNVSMSSIQAAAQETLELGASVSISTKKTHIHTSQIHNSALITLTSNHKNTSSQTCSNNPKAAGNTEKP